MDLIKNPVNKPFSLVPRKIFDGVLLLVYCRNFLLTFVQLEIWLLHWSVVTLLHKALVLLMLKYKKTTRVMHFPVLLIS